MLRYYGWLLLRALWRCARLAKDIRSWLLLGAGIAFAAASLVLEIVPMPVIPPWVIAGSLVLLLAYAILRENYEQIARERAENAILRERLKRRLELSFDPRLPSCCERGAQSGPLGNQEYCLYRIRVKNVSGQTIDDVQVRLLSFSPQNAPFLPMPLRIMNDGHPPRRSFTLHPDEEQYVDVAAKRTPLRRQSGVEEIALRYVEGRPNLVPPQRYTLHLEAIGREAPAERRIIVLDVDLEGRLLCEDAGSAAATTPEPAAALQSRGRSGPRTIRSRFIYGSRPD